MTTYYEYTGSHLTSSSAPSGLYSSGGNDITVTSSEAFPTSGSAASVILDVTGSFFAGLWFQGGLILSKGSNDLIFSTVSGGLSGVTGIGSESPITAGLYQVTPIGDQTFTPAKEGYTFDPPSFTFNGASGSGVSTSFTASLSSVPPSKPINPTPIDTGEDIVLLPTLSWEAG